MGLYHGPASLRRHVKSIWLGLYILHLFLHIISRLSDYQTIISLSLPSTISTSFQPCVSVLYFFFYTSGLISPSTSIHEHPLLNSRLQISSSFGKSAKGNSSSQQGLTSRYSLHLTSHPTAAQTTSWCTVLPNPYWLHNAHRGCNNKFLADFNTTQPPHLPPTEQHRTRLQTWATRSRTSIDIIDTDINLN
ncbi:hypothetical protein P153DRAFT_38811 [Dothidotthia symphoricarpi CBS 119687]|uniref:Uncharacterized protein n=1 Tax=Dothidotthia symphoricarpi CBS 119687 TaxID=1392245 RepID=A0A6A6A947_9PLEO|nr:uncharacterized protein P153DRAFT_38811 [Dothidotthia symphoricarpi CBS 119687]KAF2128492.1 hypothetical protein P153DRAFT_38811 [Dothidotthia symphoricarpi CBS 119687]